MLPCDCTREIRLFCSHHSRSGMKEIIHHHLRKHVDEIMPQVRSLLAHVVPERGQVRRKVVTLALLELLQVVVSPVIALERNVNFKAVAEDRANRLAKFIARQFS